MNRQERRASQVQRRSTQANQAALLPSVADLTFALAIDANDDEAFCRLLDKFAMVIEQSQPPIPQITMVLREAKRRIVKGSVGKLPLVQASC